MRAFEVLAKRQGRSTNAEIIISITSSLEGLEAAVTAQNARIAYLGHERAELVLQRITPFDVRTAIGKSKKVIRLPDGVRDGVTEAVNRSIAEGGKFRSMNSWCLDVLVWWINNQREANALLVACINLDKERTQVRA